MIYRTRAGTSITESRDNKYLIKKSFNIQKIIEEHNYYYVLPKNIKKFLVQPHNLYVVGNQASYLLDKINDIDIGIKYANDQLKKKDFKILLKSFNEFKKYSKECKIDQFAMYEMSKNFVIGKAEKNLYELKNHGVDATYLINLLNEKFDDAYITRNTYNVCISHGDPCFSNIFIIDKKIKMIDPRGASSIYLDEYYDIAKIAQSWLYGYDFIKNDKEQFKPLYIEHFKRYIEKRNMSIKLLNIYVASLFLSMCIHHLDRSDHIQKFILIAEEILNSEHINFNGW
jgi:hypothetical protein